jgi:hypothetical protein
MANHHPNQVGLHRRRGPMRIRRLTDRRKWPKRGIVRVRQKGEAREVRFIVAFDRDGQIIDSQLARVGNPVGAGHWRWLRAAVIPRDRADLIIEAIPVRPERPYGDPTHWRKIRANGTLAELRGRALRRWRIQFLKRRRLIRARFRPQAQKAAA